MNKCEYAELLSIARLYVLQECNKPWVFSSLGAKIDYPPIKKQQPVQIVDKPILAPQIKPIPSASIVPKKQAPIPREAKQSPTLPAVIETEEIKNERPVCELSDIRKIVSDLFPHQRIVDVIPSALKKAAICILVDDNRHHPFLVNLKQAMTACFGSAEIISVLDSGWRNFVQADTTRLILASQKVLNKYNDLNNAIPLEEPNVYMQDPLQKFHLWKSISSLCISSIGIGSG